MSDLGTRGPWQVKSVRLDRDSSDWSRAPLAIIRSPGRPLSLLLCLPLARLPSVLVPRTKSLRQSNEMLPPRWKFNHSFTRHPRLKVQRLCHVCSTRVLVRREGNASARNGYPLCDQRASTSEMPVWTKREVVLFDKRVICCRAHVRSVMRSILKLCSTCQTSQMQGPEHMFPTLISASEKLS